MKAGVLHRSEPPKNTLQKCGDVGGEGELRGGSRLGLRRKNTRLDARVVLWASAGSSGRTGKAQISSKTLNKRKKTLSGYVGVGP